MKTAIKMLIVLLVSGSNAIAQSYGEIRGLIQNKEYEVVSYATIKVLQANVLVAGGQTDDRGKYSIKPLTPGVYDLVIMHPEYMTQTIHKITVTPNNAAYVDWKLQTNDLTIVDVVAPEVDFTNTGVDVNVFHTISLSGKDLEQNSGVNRGDIKNVLTVMTAEAITDSKGDIHVRGARAGTTGYFIDGVRTMEANYLPGLSIENVSAFTGGVPAMYGDLSSGAVMITTKSYFSGLREKMVREANAAEAKRLEAEKKKAMEEEAKRKAEIEAEQAEQSEKK